jgi:hypothetical protein
MVQKTKSMIDKNMNYIILLAVLSMLGIQIPGITPENTTESGVKIEQVKDMQRVCYDRIELTEDTQNEKNRQLNRRIDDTQDEQRELKRDLMNKFEELRSLSYETLNRLKRLETNYLTTYDNEEIRN